MKAPHVYRSASKGKPFTRNEKINIINRNKAIDAARATRKELVAIEKAKIEQDRKERELAAKIRKVLISEPTVKKIKTKKDGTAYYQPRVGGKLGAAIAII